jgi:hypothetical protein
MNKRLMILLSIVTMAFSIRLPAQPANSGVELRLNLIQGVGGSSIKSLVLSVSVINHSDSDVYIPGLRYMIYSGGVDLYREENGKFIAIDMLGIQRNVHPVMVPDTDNVVTSFYSKDLSPMYRQQDSLVVAFCRNNHLSTRDWRIPGNQPLFLKAGQQLDNFVIINIDHTWKKTGQYKIEYDANGVDSAYSPSEILGYRRFPTGRIKSNTLYFSNIAYDQMGKN